MKEIELFEGEPLDGEVFSLAPNPDAIKVEYINTKERKGFRVYDRFGRGLFITRHEMVVFEDLINKVLANEDKMVCGKQNFCGHCTDEPHWQGMESEDDN